MKKNIRCKIKKEYIILFIYVLLFSIVANNAFLQRHYSSDTMCLMDLGYFEYPSKYFLLDGRIFSSLLCYLGGILNLPFDTYLFISNLTGIVILSLTIVVLFRFIIGYLEVNNKWVKLMILLSVYTIIFNHMDIEYLLFPESCIMCAGVLLSVIATITYLNPQKGKKNKAILILIISALCYQGVISIFPVLVIVLKFLKMKKDDKEIIKYYVKEMFLLGLMFVLALLITALLIAIFNTFLQDSSYRLERIQNISTIAVQLPYIWLDILLYQTENIPAYLSVIIIGISIIIIIKYSNNLNLLLKYRLSIFTAYLLCITPIIIFGYVHPRMLMAVGSVMGISLLFITNILNDNNISLKSIKTIAICICVISYFTFNVTNNYINSYQHLKAFAIDEKIGKEISRIIKKYEENSGIEIRKFAYCYDKNPQSYEEGIKELGSLTERKFAMPYCIKGALNYYCNKELEEVQFSYEVYYNNFYEKDYNAFSEEQLVFVNDTLYMYVY